MMIIPLTRKQEYKVFSLIGHPVKLGPTDLVLPELRDVILINDYTYIITNNINVYSISLKKQKSTCEWEGFEKNSTSV